MRKSERTRETSMAETAMAHVLLFPFPAQGHVTPMLKLAELLSNAAGLYITFVNCESIHRRLLLSSPEFDHLSRRSNFRFCTIADGPPDTNTQSFLDLVESLSSQWRKHYRDMLVPKDGQDPDGWPPVTCVVADGVLPLSFEVAKEVGVPVMILRSSSACSVWAYCSVHVLIKRGEIPIQDDADMDELIQGVAGLESFLRRRDIPGGLLRQAKSIGDPEIEFVTKVSDILSRAKALILNTTESIDSLVLPHIRSVCPVTYTIGPLQLLLQNSAYCGPEQDGDNIGHLTSSSLWHEDRSCMMWLDSQTNNSVVYVSFGSLTVMSRATFLEFWHGLLNSDQRFLWVIRPDMVGGGIDESEFDRRDQGYFVKWAPQEEVLAHPAVGCFLTHSGWNSTLESIVAGVPMICWPFVADQQMNSRFVSEVWKIGVDMKDSCERNVVEKMVRKLMSGEEAEKLRRSASEMSQMSKRAAEEGGSSYVNFQKLVEHIESLSFGRDQISD